MDNKALIDELNTQGFITITDIYTDAEVQNILDVINAAPTNNSTFRKTADLFAIRQFLKEVPQVKELVFNNKLLGIISALFGQTYFATKAIYFDKPAKSNWFVAYHQDLTISVDKRANIAGFGPWTVKQNQFAVQPPIGILQNNFTTRIHLDDTDENNGALRIVKGSNQKGEYRPETIDWLTETEIVCPVKKGGIMIMRPLLLHASSRSTNDEPRRVIHIEFSNSQLPEEINWSEKTPLSYETH